MRTSTAKALTVLTYVVFATVGGGALAVGAGVVTTIFLNNVIGVHPMIGFGLGVGAVTGLVVNTTITELGKRLRSLEGA